MSKLKLRPTFKSDAQEAAFWASHASTEYSNYTKGCRAIFPRLKPLAEMISLRLPKSLLDQLKALTNGPLNYYLTRRVDRIAVRLN